MRKRLEVVLGEGGGPPEIVRAVLQQRGHNPTLAAAAVRDLQACTRLDIPFQSTLTPTFLFHPPPVCLSREKEGANIGCCSLHNHTLAVTSRYDYYNHPILVTCISVPLRVCLQRVETENTGSRLDEEQNSFNLP